jgi:hypothetical protein
LLKHTIAVKSLESVLTIQFSFINADK